MLVLRLRLRSVHRFSRGCHPAYLCNLGANGRARAPSECPHAPSMVDEFAWRQAISSPAMAADSCTSKIGRVSKVSHGVHDAGVRASVRSFDDREATIPVREAIEALEHGWAGLPLRE